MKKNSRYVITGGPGAGKSSLINALRDEGYSCFDEVSRQIIRQQQANQGNCVPWGNLTGFALLNQKMMIQQYHSAQGDLCFFDRALPDIPAYFSFKKEELPKEVIHSIQTHRYYPTIFICPPWKEIFVNDAERPESYEDSCQIFHHLKSSYQNYGYQTVELPRVSLTSRVKFISDHLYHINPPSINVLF